MSPGPAPALALGGDLGQSRTQAGADAREEELPALLLLENKKDL
jgi:hypothetical protein